MTTSRADDSPAEELQRINLDLAHLFHREPLPVSFGAQQALADSLVVCGLLGGKDVGKSTLINALAGQQISADVREVGPGTNRPVAYVHAEMVECVRQRFRPAAPTDLVEVAKHQLEGLRNIVLLDLPDFDSEFSEHAEIVGRVAPLLDRIVWVVTPRKIGDREWVRLFHEVIKDARNVHCVLNKVDELVGDDQSWFVTGARRRSPVHAGAGTAAAREDSVALRTARDDGDTPVDRATRIWSSLQSWVRETAVESGCGSSDERLFLIAAAYPEPEAFIERIGVIWADPDWRHYSADCQAVAHIAAHAHEELVRLRAALLRPISGAEAGAIKRGNQRRELCENAARIRAHYQLDTWLGLVERACDPEYLQSALAEALPEEYRQQVCRKLALSRKSDVELADGLLAERVERWPILRVVYWPLSWLVRRLGRGMARATDVRSVSGDPFYIGGRSLADRVRLLLAQFRDDHARVVQHFNLESRLPAPEHLAARVTAACETLVEDLDRQTLRDLTAAYRKPSFLSRGLLWFVLLWFPLMQPVADGLLAIAASDGALSSIRGLHQLVAVLGAGPLLRGLVLVLAIYVACLAAMYARCIRDVRRARLGANQSPTAAADEALALLESLDEILTSSIAEPLCDCWRAEREQLRTHAARLVAVERGDQTTTAAT
ncbi:MAG TPA: GTPase domain-containing protein [Phycisphaerae bacterium]